MGNATIKLDKLEKKAVEVQGADTGDDSGPFEDGYPFEVKRMKSALANGCPAYIIINGRKYRI